MDFLSTMKKLFEHKQVEYIMPKKASKKEIEEHQEHLERTDAIQEEVGSLLKASGNFGKDFLENVHKLYIKEMLSEFKSLKEKTAGRPIGLGECVKATGALSSYMLTMAPAVGIQEFFATYSYWLEGEKDYYVSANLCPRLKASHIKSIPIELLELPFRSFRILLPEGVLPFTTYEEQRVFVREMIIVDYIQNVEDVMDEADGKRRLMVFHRAKDDIGHFAIVIDENEVHLCVEKSVKRMRENTEIVRAVRKTKHDFNQNQESELREMFEFAVKCILYITGANADVEYVDEAKGLNSELSRAKSGRRLAKLQRRLERAKKGYLVGHKIVLSREERVMYANLSSGLWKLNYRFIVQGHWRNQAWGKDMSLRKLMFISPYWKGPEFTDVVNSPHVLK